MKIAFDYTIFMIQKYGGISRYFIELSKALNSNANCKIIAPISINNHLNQINQNLFNLKKINKIPIFTTKLISNLNLLTSSIYMKSWKPDIIHKTYFNTHSYKSINSKKILNVWDLSHEIYPEFYNKNKNWRPKKQALELADHIICSSYKTRNDLEKYYNFNLKKTSVVYQGVNHSRNLETVNYNKEKYLLYVGSRLKYKNFENLLKALSINKQILEDFKLVCFGEEKITPLEKDLIESLNLNKKNIMFISGDDQKLHNYYLNSTALLYPSKNEGFGFPPLEAMSFGCPVITSNNPAIIEATDLSEYSFDPESPEDIVLKIQNIIYSKSNINFLISHGLKRIDKLSWGETSQNILKIYEKVLS